MAFLVSCGAVSRPPLPTEIGYSHAPPGSSSAERGVPPAPRDVVSRAIEDISPGSFRRDLNAIAVPRSRDANPHGLTTVARWVRAELEKSGYAVYEQIVSYDGSKGTNLIAERPGSDPSRVVIVSAHYDAVSGTAGADDDASGVAGVLGAARVIANVETEASVRFVTFCFEEDGLVGSQAYVKALSPEERARVAGVFNLEMIGYVDHKDGGQSYPTGMELLAGGRKLPTRGEFVGVVGAPADASMLDAAERARSYVRDLPVEILRLPRAAAVLAPDLLRSDHAPFWLAEMPAALIGDTANFRNPNYHRQTDITETLDLAFAAQVTRWTAAAAMLLAGPRGPAAGAGGTGGAGGHP